MMSDMIKLALAVLSIPAMSSCATVFVRSDSAGEPAHVFPATKFDAEFFWRAGIKGEPLLAPADPDNKNSPGARLAYGTGAIIDAPFSVVSDVILLPSDLIRIRGSKEDKKSKGEQFVDDNPS
jgi:uncharacterized protein YceK